jgi:hypothetical protein
MLNLHAPLEISNSFHEGWRHDTKEKDNNSFHEGQAEGVPSFSFF